MPWRLKQRVILIILGVAVLVLSCVVWILNQDASTDILAVIAVITGAAIVVSSLPSNGNGEH